MTPVRKIFVAGFSALALGAAALAPTAASAHGSGGFGVGLGIGLGLGLLRPPVYAPVPYPVYHGPGYHSCSSVTVTDPFGNRITRRHCRDYDY
jgi:hypothetical protein